MNKSLFALLCLLILACGIGSVCASDATNATANHDFLQTNAHPLISDSVGDTNASQISSCADYRIIKYNPSSTNSTNTDGNGTVPGSNVNSTNHSIKEPKLNIKGPKLQDKIIIKGPKLPFNVDWAAKDYNDVYKRIAQGHLTHGYEECDIVCLLLLEIYKDYNADQTKLIAHKVLNKNNFTISQDTVDWFFRGICGKEILHYYPYHDGSPFDYFTKFYNLRKYVETGKLQIGDGDLKDARNYVKNILDAGGEVDIWKFVLFVYKDHDLDMTTKIVAKAYTEYMWKYGCVQDTQDIKHLIDNVRGGNFGGDMYVQLHDLEFFKNPANILFGGLSLAYHHFMGSILS